MWNFTNKWSKFSQHTRTKTSSKVNSTRAPRPAVTQTRVVLPTSARTVFMAALACSCYFSSMDHPGWNSALHHLSSPSNPSSWYLTETGLPFGQGVKFKFEALYLKILAFKKAPNNNPTKRAPKTTTPQKPQTTTPPATHTHPNSTTRDPNTDQQPEGALEVKPGKERKSNPETECQSLLCNHFSQNQLNLN